MTAFCVAALPIGHLTLDYCAPCRGIWFDPQESTRLEPDSVLELFRIIRETADTNPVSPKGIWLCPRCDAGLAKTHDVSRGGPFAYERCPNGHGRFTPYAQFLTEKGFVRHLAKAEIEQIGAVAAQISCHACGGPIDLRHDTACPHCRASIAVLDPHAMQQAVSAYVERCGRSADGIEGRLSVPHILASPMPPPKFRSLIELGIHVVVDFVG